MAERSLIPNEGKLIPYATVKQPPLSPLQAGQVLNVARLYLSERKIPIDENTLTLAISVAGDALQRQLIHEGRVIFTPKERLPSRIRDGFLLREYLRKEAIDAVNLTTGNPTTDKEITGPFAVPSIVVTSAQYTGPNNLDSV